MCGPRDYIFPKWPARLFELDTPDLEQPEKSNQTFPPGHKMVTYPSTKQAKEKVACVGLSRSLGQSLRHVGVHYPAERYLQGCLEVARLCAHESIADAAVNGLPTPVAVDQCAAKYLEEAVRSFPAMWSRCRSSHADDTFRRQLPVFRVVRCSSVHCFQTRIIVELFCCTRAPIE
ncbi:uncharacterized protein TNCV_433251 [Trichonephila clavipes]|nr:uncharacterized protein TNCV_433251 [Trichonephila clavipes]